MSRILVADDEKSMVEMLEIMFQKEGYSVVSAYDSGQAIEILGNEKIDLIVSDMKIPKDGGISILRESLQRDRTRPVIMITAYASAQSAVEAMKMGAFDYITKPFNVDELKIVVKNALERRNLIMENRNLKNRLKENSGVNEMIGRSPSLNAVKKVILRIAESGSTVIISGESGTGKELAARAIHAHSGRFDKPFLSINCGAMPENLLESELFGHKKGAFTGASIDKKGLLEAANGGAFFLDEVAEMPLSLQVKLLRAIQEKEIRRVGGVNDIKLDVRFIAATNIDLKEAVKAGSFREDLYYRLNVIHIHMPPLRERTQDIPILAKTFLEKFNAINNRLFKGFTPETMKLLENYHWRGNVRELENVVERAVVLETGDWVTPESLPENILFPEGDTASISIPSGGVDLEKRISEIEKGMIESALAQASGSKKDASKLLNMNLRSFRYKLSKYDLKG
ncbi:MAG: sigma-54 dependent transcriptional regulator [Nitrospinota bacterium]